MLVVVAIGDAFSWTIIAVVLIYGIVCLRWSQQSRMNRIVVQLAMTYKKSKTKQKINFHFYFHLEIFSYLGTGSALLHKYPDAKQFCAIVLHRLHLHLVAMSSGNAVSLTPNVVYSIEWELLQFDCLHSASLAIFAQFHVAFVVLVCRHSLR